jgi:dCMP deaminase
MAAVVATKSKDPSTVVGAVIVGPEHDIRATGFNGFPRGVTDSSARLHDREAKYAFTVHAEANAVVHLGRERARGCTLYANGMPPCSECAKLIIQAGIARVCCTEAHADVPDRWAVSVARGRTMLEEAGVIMDFIPMPEDQVVNNNEG